MKRMESFKSEKHGGTRPYDELLDREVKDDRCCEPAFALKRCDREVLTHLHFLPRKRGASIENNSLPLPFQESGERAKER
jgi:hypothetical protein